MGEDTKFRTAAEMKEQGRSQVTGDNLWSFNYRRGMSLVMGVVRARDEERARHVAEAWCRQAGFKFTFSVTPMVLADESILVAEAVMPPLGRAVPA